jgi:TonB family protein
MKTNPQFAADNFNQYLESRTAGEARALCPEWDSLVAIAAELLTLPDPDFKNRLKAELMEEAGSLEAGAHYERVEGPALATILPSLGGKGLVLFPSDHRSFLISFISHAALVVLIASGIWVGHSTMTKPKGSQISELTYIPGTGGGAGGDHSLLPAMKGTPPPFERQQLTPPTIVVPNPNPKLLLQPSVVGPPDVKLPQSNQIGDLASTNVVLPSNGTGSGGGMGSNSSGGVGSGSGVGVGQGGESGIGGGAPRLGMGLKAPRVIYDPDPEFSDEARRVKHQGTVILSVIVDQQGRAKDVYVVRSLGMRLDEKAIEAVQKWKFAPGTKDGYPFAVRVNVEVNFRLY